MGIVVVEDDDDGRSGEAQRSTRWIRRSGFQVPRASDGLVHRLRPKCMVDSGRGGDYGRNDGGQKRNRGGWAKAVQVHCQPCFSGTRQSGGVSKRKKKNVLDEYGVRTTALRLLSSTMGDGLGEVWPAPNNLEAANTESIKCSS